jgi:hypothetical protein
VHGKKYIYIYNERIEQIVTGLGLIRSVIKEIQLWSVTDTVFGAQCSVRPISFGLGRVKFQNLTRADRSNKPYWEGRGTEPEGSN